MQKTAIIIPYYGKWPEWMDLYLYSCSKNPQLDFLIITDIETPHKVYSNTHFIYMTFEECCNRISQTLHVKFRPNDPYSFCACKPFYGIVFEHELVEYDWWGFGDIDLVYGDTSLLVNEKNLNKYDFITAHSDRFAGHFTIMRKESQFTHACLKIPHYKELLSGTLPYIGLDEASCYRRIVLPLHRYWKGVYKLFAKHFYYDMVDGYRYFDMMDKITSFLHPRILMREQYSTPVPQVGETWTYNLKTAEIGIPNGHYRKLPHGGGKMYLHFLFFKKTKYKKTEYYWRPGFWQIPDNYDWNNSNDTLEITNEYIRIKK